jgi:outer membrane protein OmpA-like peptidoglycan-associated protein
VWVAPTGAVVLSGILLVSSGLLDRDSAVVVTAQPQAIAPQIPATTQTAVATDSTLDSLQIVDAIKRAKTGVDDAEVTKNSAIPVLESLVAQQALSEPVPSVIPEAGDSAAAANFFANAQANLAQNNSCAEDLESLTSRTSIYFPAGGTTAEDSGLIKGRVIGQVISGCPGYTLEGRGHSDPSGNSQINLDLSKRRAEAVIGLLASSGIDTSNFVAVGMGDRVPSNIEGPNGSAYYDRRVDFAVVKTSTRTASLGGIALPWTAAPASGCAVALEQQVAQTRLFYGTRAVTVSPSELDAVYELATAVSACEGARLRVVGQHSDQEGDRENIETGRLRALVLMGSLVSAGFESERILIGAPSYAQQVPGQPGLPKSRVDFQVIMD